MDPRNIGRRPPPFVCNRCKQNECVECIDVLRMVYTNNTICKCKRKNHSGEPNEQQIADPITGDVYTPELVIKQDGKITRRTDG